MTLDKPNKVGCKFYNNVISYHKDKLFFHLGYQHDGNERIFVVMCLRAQAQFKALFTTCGKIIPRPLDDVVVLAPNGPIEIMTIERLNPSMEREFASYSQVKRAQIYTPCTNSTKGFNKSMKHNAQIFRHVSL
jgi:hypothetical protein